MTLPNKLVVLKNCGPFFFHHLSRLCQPPVVRSLTMRRLLHLQQRRPVPYLFSSHAIRHPVLFHWEDMAQRQHYSTPAVSADAMHDPSIVRNVAVIAHVDHGKTTLVDQLIKTGLLDRASGSGVEEEAAAALDGSRALDSGALEKERGITIMSKTTRVDWGGAMLNLVDTPGHSDFGGEVERVLSMVDGAILVVDATEGVMSQTKFVVSRAVRQGLKFIVVLNKADRDTARLGGEVEDEIFDLLVAMDASDEQLDFPIIYASAKEGWCVEDSAHVDPALRKEALGADGLDSGECCSRDRKVKKFALGVCGLVSTRESRCIRGAQTCDAAEMTNLCTFFPRKIDYGSNEGLPPIASGV